MKLTKLWVTLGFISLIMGLGLFIYSFVIRNNLWKWQNFKSYESAVSVSICVGIALFVVVIIEYWWKNYTKRR